MTTSAVRTAALRDTTAIVAGLILLVVALLWAAWEIDFSLSRTAFIRIVAAMILVGFVLFAVLFVTLLVVERLNHYGGKRTSPLHLPMLISTGALMVYFGLASIQAVDVYYEPATAWPLMRDPTVQLLTASTILVIVGAKAWLLWEILPDDSWVRRKSRRSPPGAS